LTTYQPQYTSQADSSAWNAANTIYNNNPYAQNQPLYASVEQQGYNNPYMAGAQTSANNAGAQYTAAGTQGAAASAALNNGAMSLLPYVSQVASTAFDPQNAIYNQGLNNTTAAANVSNAQYGLTGPYAASTTDNAVTNYNNTWQNNQLNRQATGMSAMATGIGAAGSGATAASNIGQTGAASTALGGSVPNTAYIANLASMLNALNSYGTSQTNADNVTQGAESDFMNYLSGGENQATQLANLQNINYANQQNYVNDENAQLEAQVNSIMGIGGSDSDLNANYGGGSSLGAMVAQYASDMSGGGGGGIATMFA
jgi:hypothetical protein